MTSPYVEYGYADGAANTLRPTTITYPNGRTLTYDYGGSGDPNDLLSRVYEIIDDDEEVLTQYEYLGTGGIVAAAYPEPGVAYNLTYEGVPGDPLAGCLDSLGRVIQAPWLKDGVPLAGAKYEYDRIGNRTRMEPLGYAATDDVQRYRYDGLDRLTNLARGPSDAAQGAERWGLDATGNWREYGALSADDPARNLEQRRTADAANELTAIDNFYGASWAQPAYDRAGNMTAFPQPAAPTDGYQATYDAWNRLAELRDGATVVGAYAYDAKTRRVTQSASGATRHAYYSLAWRNLEERLDASTSAERQFVWGTRYVDDLILRDQGSVRYYNLQDGNWNTVAVVDDEGDVQQRFRYAAYGEPTRLNADGSVTTDPDAILWETLFAGYRFEQATGLYAVRFRYLNSTLGAWITRDPILYDDSFNLWHYVRSNPLKNRDSLGLGIDKDDAYAIVKAFLASYSATKGFHGDKARRASDRECSDRVLGVASRQLTQQDFKDLGKAWIFIGVESVPNTPLKISIPIELYQQYSEGEIDPNGITGIIEDLVYAAAEKAGLPASETKEEALKRLRPSIDKLVQDIVKESLPWHYGLRVTDPGEEIIGAGESVTCDFQVRAGESKWRIDATCDYLCIGSEKRSFYCCCGPYRNVQVSGARGSREPLQSFAGTGSIDINPRP